MDSTPPGMEVVALRFGRDNALVLAAGIEQAENRPALLVGGL